MRKLNKDIFLSHTLSQETTTGYILYHKNVGIRQEKGKQFEIQEDRKGVPSLTAMENHRKRADRSKSLPEKADISELGRLPK